MCVWWTHACRGDHMLAPDKMLHVLLYPSLPYSPEIPSPWTQASPSDPLYPKELGFQTYIARPSFSHGCSADLKSALHAYTAVTLLTQSSPKFQSVCVFTQLLSLISSSEGLYIISDLNISSHIHYTKQTAVHLCIIKHISWGNFDIVNISIQSFAKPHAQAHYWI